MTRLCSDRRQRPPTLGDLVVAVTDFAMEISDDEEQASPMASKAINEYLEALGVAESKIRRTTPKSPD